MQMSDVDRVRVPDAGRQLRLEQEAGARLGDRRERRTDGLYRDAFADLGVQALVNRAHSALAEEANDAVLAQAGARRQRPSGRPPDAFPRPLHMLLKRKSDADRAKTGRGGVESRTIADEVA